MLVDALLALDRKAGRRVVGQAVRGGQALLDVPAQPDPAGQAELATVVGPAQPEHRAALRPAARLGHAGETGLAALLGDDVDDPAGAAGLELRRGAGQHLDAVNVAGGELLQAEAGRGAGELRRGLAVHQDRDVAVPPEADGAVGVHRDGGDGVEHLGGGAGRGLQIAGYRIDLAVDQGLGQGPLSGHHQLLHAGGRRRRLARRRRGGLGPGLGSGRERQQGRRPNKEFHTLPRPPPGPHSAWPRLGADA